MGEIIYNNDGVLYNINNDRVYYNFPTPSYHYPLDINNSAPNGVPLYFSTGASFTSVYTTDHNGVADGAYYMDQNGITPCNLWTIANDIFPQDETIYSFCFWVNDDGLYVHQDITSIGPKDTTSCSSDSPEFNFNYTGQTQGGNTRIFIDNVDCSWYIAPSASTSGWTFVAYTYDGDKGRWYLGDNNNEPSLYWTSQSYDGSIYLDSQFVIRFTNTIIPKNKHSKPIHDIFIWIGKEISLEHIKYIYNTT